MDTGVGGGRRERERERKGGREGEAKRGREGGGEGGGERGGSEKRESGELFIRFFQGLLLSRNYRSTFKTKTSTAH